MYEVTNTTADHCAQEPIHTHGCIQSQAVLLCVCPQSLTIIAVSENFATLLGRVQPELGLALGSVLPEDAMNAILSSSPLRHHLIWQLPPDWLAPFGGEMRVHIHGDVLYCEIEPLRQEDAPAANDIVHAQRVVAEMAAASSLGSLADIAADGIRRISGMERSLVFQFDPSNNGEVIGEALIEGWDASFKGFRFPADDITVQARNLCRIAPNRFIPSLKFIPQAIEPPFDPRTGQPFDLSRCHCHSPAQSHLEYQANLGVDSSLTLSLVTGDRLWGLIIGHHRQPHRVPIPVRPLLDMIARAFLANMSHEMRTPMHAIIGFTRGLRRKINDPQQDGQLAKIDQAARHLLALINDVLNMSKIEAGKMSVTPEDFLLADLLENVTSQVSHLIEGSHCHLRIDVAVDVPTRLHGDVRRLSQCLINYINNAAKFTRDGLVEIRVAIEQSDGAEAGENILIRFEVEDTGIGMEPEVLERLFTTFEQADDTITRRFGGTGLGLSITRQLAELMGGSVGVTSRPGAGSCFWFTALLRAARGDGGAFVTSPGYVGPDRRNRNNGDEGSPAARPAKRFGNARILVAEDIALNREILEDMLDEFGLRADMAADGLIATGMASHGSYDLILMDMQMPVMDGISAARAIRRLPGHAETPIIALTANAFDDDRRNCLDAGMNDFISKPLQDGVLYAKLAKWLEKPGQNKATGPVFQALAGTIDRQRLRDCLGGVADIDLEQDSSFQSKPARYAGYLLKYAETHGDSMGRLRKALADGDLAGVHRIAHSLRGTSAQVGVVGIQTLAAVLEENVKNKSDDGEILRQAEAIETRLAVVCAAINKLRN